MPTYPAPISAARRPRNAGTAKSREFPMKSRAAIAFGAAVMIATPALAHHSFAMFDQRKIMTLDGTVTEFQWTNPHAFIEIDVPSEGKQVHWSIELNSPNNL